MVSTEDEEWVPPSVWRRKFSWKERLRSEESVTTRSAKPEKLQPTERTEDLPEDFNGDRTTVGLGNSNNVQSFSEFASVAIPHSEPETNNSVAAIKHVFLPKAPLTLLKSDIIHKQRHYLSMPKLGTSNNSPKHSTANQVTFCCDRDSYCKPITDFQMFKTLRNTNKDHIHLSQKRKSEDIQGTPPEKRIKPRLSVTIPETILFRDSDLLSENRKYSFQDENKNIFKTIDGTIAEPDQEQCFSTACNSSSCHNKSDDGTCRNSSMKQESSGLPSTAFRRNSHSSIYRETESLEDDRVIHKHKKRDCQCSGKCSVKYGDNKEICYSEEFSDENKTTLLSDGINGDPGKECTPVKDANNIIHQRTSNRRRDRNVIPRMGKQIDSHRKGVKKISTFQRATNLRFGKSKIRNLKYMNKLKIDYLKQVIYLLERRFDRRMPIDVIIKHQNEAGFKENIKCRPNINIDSCPSAIRKTNTSIEKVYQTKHLKCHKSYGVCETATTRNNVLSLLKSPVDSKYPIVLCEKIDYLSNEKLTNAGNVVHTLTREKTTDHVSTQTKKEMDSLESDIKTTADHTRLKYSNLRNSTLENYSVINETTKTNSGNELDSRLKSSVGTRFPIVLCKKVDHQCNESHPHSENVADYPTKNLTVSQKSLIKTTPNTARTNYTKLNNSSQVNKSDLKKTKRSDAKEIIQTKARKTLVPSKKIETTTTDTNNKFSDLKSHSRAEFHKEKKCPSLNTNCTKNPYPFPLKVKIPLKGSHPFDMYTINNIKKKKYSHEMESCKIKQHVKHSSGNLPDITKRESTSVTNNSVEEFGNKTTEKMVAIKEQENPTKIMNKVDIQTCKASTKECSPIPLQLKVSLSLSNIEVKQLILSSIPAPKDSHNQIANGFVKNKLAINEENDQIKKMITNVCNSEKENNDTTVPAEGVVPDYYCIENQDVPNGKLVVKLRRMSSVSENPQNKEEIPEVTIKSTKIKPLANENYQVNKLCEKEETHVTEKDSKTSLSVINCSQNHGSEIYKKGSNDLSKVKSNNINILDVHSPFCISVAQPASKVENYGISNENLEDVGITIDAAGKPIDPQDDSSGSFPNSDFELDCDGLLKSTSSPESCFLGFDDLNDVDDDSMNKENPSNKLIAQNYTKDVTETSNLASNPCNSDNNSLYMNDKGTCPEIICEKKDSECKIVAFECPLIEESCLNDYKNTKRITACKNIENEGLSNGPILENITSNTYEVLDRSFDIVVTETPAIEITIETSDENENCQTPLEEASSELINEIQEETTNSDSETKTKISFRDSFCHKDITIISNNDLLKSKSSGHDTRGKEQPNLDFISHYNNVFDGCTNDLCSQLGDILSDIAAEDKKLLEERAMDKSTNLNKEKTDGLDQIDKTKIECLNRLFLQVHEKICTVTENEKYRKKLLIEVFVRVNRKISSLKNMTWTVNETRLQLITFLSKDTFRLPLVAGIFFRREDEFLQDCFMAVDYIRECMSIHQPSKVTIKKEKAECKEEVDFNADFNRTHDFLSTYKSEDNWLFVDVNNLGEGIPYKSILPIACIFPSDYVNKIYGNGNKFDKDEDRVGSTLQNSRPVSIGYHNGLLVMDTVQSPDTNPQTASSRPSDVSSNAKNPMEIDNNFILIDFGDVVQNKITSKSAQKERGSLKEKLSWDVDEEHSYTDKQDGSYYINICDDCDESDDGSCIKCRNGNVGRVIQNSAKAHENSPAEKFEKIIERLSTEDIGMTCSTEMLRKLELYITGNLYNDNLTQTKMASWVKREFNNANSCGGTWTKNRTSILLRVGGFRQQETNLDQTEKINTMTKHEPCFNETVDVSSGPPLVSGNNSEKEATKQECNRTIDKSHLPDNNMVQNDEVEHLLCSKSDQKVTSNRDNTEVISLPNDGEKLNTTMILPLHETSSGYEEECDIDHTANPTVITTTTGSKNTQAVSDRIPVVLPFATKHIIQIQNISDEDCISSQDTIVDQTVVEQSGSRNTSALAEEKTVDNTSTKNNRNKELKESDTLNSQPQGNKNNKTGNERIEPPLNGENDGISIEGAVTTVISNGPCVLVRDKNKALSTNNKCYTHSNNLPITDTQEVKVKVKTNVEVLSKAGLSLIKTKDVNNTREFLIGEMSEVQTAGPSECNKTAKGRAPLKPFAELILNNNINDEYVENIEEHSDTQNEYGLTNNNQLHATKLKNNINRIIAISNNGNSTLKRKSKGLRENGLTDNNVNESLKDDSVNSKETMLKFKNQQPISPMCNSEIHKNDLSPIKPPNVNYLNRFFAGETSRDQKPCPSECKKTTKRRISLKPISELVLKKDIESMIKESANKPKEYSSTNNNHLQVKNSRKNSDRIIITSKNEDITLKRKAKGLQENGITDSNFNDSSSKNPKNNKETKLKVKNKQQIDAMCNNKIPETDVSLVKTQNLNYSNCFLAEEISRDQKQCSSECNKTIKRMNFLKPNTELILNNDMSNKETRTMVNELADTQQEYLSTNDNHLHIKKTKNNINRVSLSSKTVNDVLKRKAKVFQKNGMTDNNMNNCLTNTSETEIATNDTFKPIYKVCSDSVESVGGSTKSLSIARRNEITSECTSVNVITDKETCVDPSTIPEACKPEPTTKKYKNFRKEIMKNYLNSISVFFES